MLFGKIILAAEALWFIGWVITMICGQVYTTPPAHDYRTAIFFLIFHNVFSIATLVFVFEHVRKHQNKDKNSFPTFYGLRILVIFMFLVGAATDLDSLLETTIHLPQSNQLWYAMLSLSIGGLVLSIVALIWFLSLLPRGTKSGTLDILESQLLPGKKTIIRK